MLSLSTEAYQRMVGHCYDALPDEACGLLAGPPAMANSAGAVVSVTYPTGNAAASARVFTVEPGDHLRAERDAESRGLEILGVFHSHTHTVAYPSPTDVAQAPDPNWHYVLVSLADDAPVVRSYLIVDGNIAEEPVVLGA